MTVLSRGARVRRGGRRPGWLLLTTLLVLAIGASSALVFTNRVELLKLAVILALWAAVVAAFVSVIYRRQSEVDQARVRDLKLVYDLQLDREIAARREYELTVESQLRRELASELRAQAADEVAALRAELAALRTNLEIFFDTELTHRPALETERTAVSSYADWTPEGQTRSGEWVSSNRVTVAPTDESTRQAEESAIIDVPEEPLAPPRQTTADTEVSAHRYGAEDIRPEAYPAGGTSRFANASYGTHWRQAEHGKPHPEEWRQGEDSNWRAEGRYQPQQPRRSRHEAAPPQPEPRFDARHQPPYPQPDRQRPSWSTGLAETPPAPEPRPGAAEGQWAAPGTPGSSWVATHVDNVVGTADTANGSTAVSGPSSAGAPPEPQRGRHASLEEPGVTRAREAEPSWQYGAAGGRPQPRHSTEYEGDRTGMGVPTTPEWASFSSPSAASTGPAPEAASPRTATSASAARHRSADSVAEGNTHSGGQSVAELLARLQAEPSAGGRRRRRDP
ncbi:DUF6779 domain-containing protein [Mycobacterium botniense]|uniref:DUF6779 domain-containing protein n=1 Tax=Mycobacterium botniense TaxID=84962 RepID=A0A7I9XWN0_9MYCO|nr:DUF6779 domain-containing protein [Mycobacterium botniense]GFG74193.1 hypothetical protein MBOT_15580 [Mycobacterium botniense]